MKIIRLISVVALLTATIAADAQVRHKPRPVWRPHVRFHAQQYHPPLRHRVAVWHPLRRRRWHPIPQAIPQESAPPTPKQESTSPALYKLCKTTAAVLGVSNDMLSPYSIRSYPPRPLFSAISPWAGALYPEKMQ